MVNACADPDFFVREEREGGVGSKPIGEKTALIFLCLFWGFFGPKFSGGGVHLFTRGGGSKCYFL